MSETGAHEAVRFISLGERQGTGERPEGQEMYQLRVAAADRRSGLHGLLDVSVVQLRVQPRGPRLLWSLRRLIKLPRYDYDEIIDALEGEEDDAADSGGEDYELAG